MERKELLKDIQVGIYKITNLENNKCYIGQSKEIEKRYRSHKNQLMSNTHHNNHLQNAYNKGESFLFEVIEECSNEVLDAKEKEWISFYQSTDRNKGYNFESGGNTNKVFHKETLNKMSNSMKLYYSDENKRIAASKRRTTISIPLVEKIKEYLFYNDDDLKEVADIFGVSKNIVNHICNIDSHYYVCDYYNEYLKNRNENIEKKKNRKAIKLYRSGCTYNEISNELNMHFRNVIRRINNIKTNDDDRCRLNCINKSILKRDSLIRTLYAMGKNKIQIAEMLNIYRGTISKVLKEGTKLLNSLEDSRGIIQLQY